MSVRVGVFDEEPPSTAIFYGNFPGKPGNLRGSVRHVAPDGIAVAGLPLAAFLDHPLSLGFHQIEHGVAADADEAVRLEQCLDLFARSSTEERQAFADRRIFGTGAGILRRLYQEARVELAIYDDEVDSVIDVEVVADDAPVSCDPAGWRALVADTDAA